MAIAAAKAQAEREADEEEAAAWAAAAARAAEAQPAAPCASKKEEGESSCGQASSAAAEEASPAAARAAAASCAWPARAAQEGSFASTSRPRRSRDASMKKPTPFWRPRSSASASRRKAAEAGVSLDRIAHEQASMEAVHARVADRKRLALAKTARKARPSRGKSLDEDDDDDDERARCRFGRSQRRCGQSAGGRGATRVYSAVVHRGDPMDPAAPVPPRAATATGDRIANDEDAEQVCGESCC